MPSPRNLQRRRFLIGSATLAIGSATGCRPQDSQPSAPREPERRDVPLRISLFGSERDAEPIRRGWGAVTQQHLEFQIIPLNRSSAAPTANQLIEAANKNDVVIYPLLLVAQASAAGVIVPISDRDQEEMDQQSGRLLSAVRNGMARYAGQFYSVPLGASQPALLSTEEVEPLESWEAYDRQVHQAWNGSAAEPSAPGWAAAMFLWRAATSSSWLFDREDLQPLIETEPYVDSLRLMLQTHAKYRSKQRTPEQIWSAVREGKLAGGIGFPQTRVRAEGEVFLGYPPGTGESSKVLLDAFSPVVSLSANCRQSATAKRFIGWISGSDGGQTVRQQVAGMTDVRQAKRGGNPDDPIAGATSGYDRWLTNRLGSPLTLPTLQLIRGGDYYQSLDRQVRRALEGDASPEEALGEVAKQWQATTAEVGLKQQLRAWLRAQGMRA